MTFRDFCYAAGRFAGDWNAARSGRIVQRARNRLVGRLAARLLWGPWSRR